MVRLLKNLWLILSRAFKLKINRRDNKKTNIVINMFKIVKNVMLNSLSTLNLKHIQKSPIPKIMPPKPNKTDETYMTFFNKEF